MDAATQTAWRAISEAWLGENEQTADASDSGRSPDALRALLARAGHELAAGKDAGRLVQVIKASGLADDPVVAVVLADALWASGDWDGAIETFARLERACADGVLPPPAAWRFGALLYLRDETARAERVLSSADLSTAADADAALVAAWLAAAVWRRGDIDAAEKIAEDAMRLADRSSDPRAVAAAHVARALICAARGDRHGNAQAYRAAIRAATSAGDHVQITRIHSNLASRAIEQGDYQAAVVSADLAVEAAAGHEFMVGLALANKAEALLRLGRVDEAHAAGQEAADAVAPAGSMNAGPAYLLLGEVYRERGDRIQARWCYERGLRAGELSDDSHMLATADIGLAWVLAHDDLAQAGEHARTASERATSLERAAALNATAWVRLLADDPDGAQRAAREAEAHARATDDRAALATSLELIAATNRPPDLALLRAAQAVWESLGDRVRAARVTMCIAQRQADSARVAAAHDELAALGAAVDVGVTGYLATASVAALRHTPSITTLGRFAVTIDGSSVSQKDWQSRKTRDLLKILIAHADRPVSRDAAIEWLWADEGGDVPVARLSVALSRLRTILDPAHRHPSDHYLVADKNSIALRADRLHIDVHAFFAAAAEGARLASTENWDAAETRLRAAEELYVGDFLDDDRFQDWAIGCRERARTASMTSTRLLARATARRGDDEDAVRWLTRLLERDPYDEDAWTALIGAQQRMRRHGEARHQYGLYVRRMDELGIEPAPLESLSDKRP